MKWMRRAKERGEKERVEIEKGERGRKSERGSESGVVKREERARLLREWQRDRRGKRKRTWQGGEVKLDTKSSKKN